MQRLMTLGLCSLLGLTLMMNLNAETYTAQVVRVVDGDTLVVVDGAGTMRRIRLANIDAPEKGQLGGEESTQNLSRAVANRRVTVAVQSIDRYKRQVATVRVDGVNVNQLQVRDGMAWQYIRYDTSPELAALEKQARALRKGLWAAADPQPPWEYRAVGARGSKETQEATGTVKKSRSGICHTTTSRHYLRTKNFIPYPSLDECLNSGGRLPKG